VALAGRAAVAAAVLAAVALPIACAGDDDDAPEGGSVSSSIEDTTGTATFDTAPRIQLTLTEDGCRYDGPPVVTTGSFTADLANQSSHFGAFAVGELAEGSTLAELEAYVAKEQERWDETGELRGPPPYYTQAIRVGVPAGDIGLLPADLDPGTYAITCFNDDAPTWRGYVAAQLDVAE
jgi:hypothetical protein